MERKEFMRVSYSSSFIDSPIRECERFYYFSDGTKVFKGTMRSNHRCRDKAFRLFTLEEYRSAVKSKKIKIRKKVEYLTRAQSVTKKGRIPKTKRENEFIDRLIFESIISGETRTIIAKRLGIAHSRVMKILRSKYARKMCYSSEVSELHAINSMREGGTFEEHHLFPDII